MAFALASVQTSNSGTTSVTVTKPVSLAVGDLMVAHLACSNASAQTLSDFTATGWTLIATDESNSGTASHRASAFYKVATSGDVAASDFTFTADADAESICGAIYRFTEGAVPTGAADDDPSSTASHTFTNTLTPTYINSIMLHLVSCANGGGTSFSTYAITNNNPSWSEQYDITNTVAASDGDTTMAGASAARPEVTATGDSTASSGASVTDSVGIIVAVYPIINVTVSPAVVSLVGTVQAPSVSGGATVSPAVVTMTATIQAPTVTTPANKWTNPDKNSASWTNPDKTT